MKYLKYSALGFFVWGLLSTQFSCDYDMLMPIEEDIIPTDTTEMPPDTTEVGEPCDPEVIYFEADVLPIFVSNCAFGGCHNAASAQDGVILDNYADIIETADVEAFDLGNSELYEVITEDDPDDIMPPPPNVPLSQSQIQTVSAWILQGALNLMCDPDAEGCDTENVSFAETVQPILENHCVGCHGGGTPLGGINLSNHAGVKTVADDGRLYGSVAWLPDYSQMPQGGAKLSECRIDQIKSWIDAGASDN